MNLSLNFESYAYSVLGKSFIIFSKYLSTSYNNKNWIKNNFDTFSNGVNINRSNIHLFEESFLIHIKRVSTQKLKMLDLF